MAMSEAASASPATGEVYRAIFDGFFELDRTYYLRSKPAALPDHKEILGDDTPFRGYEFPEISSDHQSVDFTNSDVNILDWDEIRKLFKKGCEAGWDQFHEIYPEARVLFGLSEIGFKAEGTEAVVYVEIGSGCLLGIGYVFYLRYDNDRWKIVDDKHLWGSY